MSTIVGICGFVYIAGIAQRLVHLPSTQRMSVRFRLPALNAPILLIGLGGHPLKVEIRVRVSLGVQRVLRIWYYAFYSSKKGYMMGTTEVRNNTLFGSTVYGQQLSFPSKCAINLGASTIKDEIVPFLEYGSVVELVDTPALGAGPFGGVGSSPTRPTKKPNY